MARSVALVTMELVSILFLHSKNMKVLIADDHAMIRSGLSLMLEQTDEIEVVADVSSGEQAYETYCREKPDIVLMDMNMPGIGGLESTRRIKARAADAKIIIYSMHDNALYAKQAIAAGAAGYLIKSGEISELFAAIKLVYSGQQYLSHSIALKIALNSSSPIDSLTTREFEVLCLLASGLSVKEIASLFTISKKTVATYQTQLKHKLNINNAVDLIKLAYEYDLVN
ncbi:MAG: response regulator transcription factor [Gammaproteobacteria bacterium]|nr:response regulator transcription factor [Gammaproteobacteria bacterium]